MREASGVLSTRRRNSPDLLQPSKTGYLVLPPEAHDRLVNRNEPIEAHYEIEPEPFARGKYAAVRRCRHRETKETYAAKCVKVRRSAARGGVSSLVNEEELYHEVAVLHACAPCPHIVNLHGVYIQPNEMVLLLELAPGGDLQTILDADNIIEEHIARRFMKQILAAVRHLHLELNVVHLDIKPQNVVLTGNYPDCDVKLCDFGISRFVGDEVREIKGTPDYVAPEVLDYNPISLATDMWSVGVLLYVLLTGCSPFGGDTKQETFCNISQVLLDFPDEYFGQISDEAVDLMKRLMVKKPSGRLSVEECLQHSWFELDDKPPPLPNSPPPNQPSLESPAQRKIRTSVIRSPSLRKPAPETPCVIKRACSANTAPVAKVEDLAKPTWNNDETFQLMDRLSLTVSPKTDPVCIEEEVKKAETVIPAGSNSDSDCISDMSIDSSIDSFLSTNDSGCSNFGSDDWTVELKAKKWEGGLIRAKSAMNLSEGGTLRKKMVLKRFFEQIEVKERECGLKLVQEKDGNEVVIREVKGGRVSKFGSVKCESVKSRIRKLEGRC